MCPSERTDSRHSSAQRIPYAPTPYPPTPLPSYSPSETASLDGPTPSCRIAGPTAFIQRHLLWLLLACYGLAMIWPSAGLAMRGWKWDVAALNGQITFQLLLLAWMLFCAAVTTDIREIRWVFGRPLVLLIGVAGVWAGPALLVILAGWLAPGITANKSAAGLMLGLSLVATMPVANSSVGWVQNARGNLALGLGLVVMSISLSPWITPRLLAAFGKTLSPAAQAECERLMGNYSGWFFVVWVVLPTAIGFAMRWVITPGRVAAAAGWLAILSAAALLLLNYISASLALPKASQSSPLVLMTAATLAVALGAVGMALGWTLAWALRLPSETRSPLLFGLSMKNTGLALVLADAIVADRQYVVLLIVLATLAQHVLAGGVQWLQMRRG